MFINALLDQAQKAGGPGALMAGMPVSTIATAVLIAGTVLTPLFMWYLRQPGDAWLTNAFVSALLYPVAIGRTGTSTRSPRESRVVSIALLRNSPRLVKKKTWARG